MPKSFLAVPIWIAIGTLIFASTIPTSITAAITSTSPHPDDVSLAAIHQIFSGHHQSPALATHDKAPEADRIRHGPVAFETIFQGDGRASAGVTVINDPDTWSEFWRQNCSVCAVNITSGTPIMPTPPQIDFTTHTVIVASPGLEGSPGVLFKINTVINHAHHIIIDATRTNPGPNCVWIQVVVFPVQIIIIPKTSLSVMLEMNTIQGPACSF